MTTFEDGIRDEYFDWMYHIVCGESYPGRPTYRKLLTHLHNREFTYIIPRDSNRYEDGVSLRHRFFYYNHPSITYREYILDGPCSVLEMMVALTIYCEESIMDDPAIGDRTKQWFWEMVVSLGLGGMNDEFYDPKTVDRSITRFLTRQYEPDGRGGLFTIRNSIRDLRTAEIHYQLCWYLDTIT